jgi:leucine-rich repeat protein SHOC2
MASERALELIAAAHRDRAKKLDLSGQNLTELPDSIGQLYSLVKLDLNNNQLVRLPEEIGNLTRLNKLYLSNNQLKALPKLKNINFLGVTLNRRYWIKISEWKSEWILDERNAEVRRRLIDRLGYEKICDELGAIEIDTWNEYTLLKIDNIQIIYQGWQEIGREPMMLLKMTCPSTAHIHILRVPPDMTSAEDAIVWVNHGIHPLQFSVQT